MSNRDATCARPHRSRSGEAAKRAELERVLNMTLLQRVALALALGKRRQELERLLRQRQP
jgi:hypothetical protein